MKKILAIALVLCLVLGAAFAAKGDIKVGGQLGFVESFASMKAGADNKNYFGEKISVGGFGFEVGGLYDVTDEVSVKASLGLSFFGKGKTRGYVVVDGDTVTDETEPNDENMPMKFSAYIGGQYAFAINKQIKVSAGAGLDMAFGKLDKDDDEKLFSLGIGAEVVGSYAINKNIDVLFGARYSFFFVNSSETLNDYRKTAKDYDTMFKFNASALRIFAGATYKI